MSLEIWKPVVGYEKFYQVSDQGRIRRIVGRNGLPGKVRELKFTGVVYPSVNLYNGNGPKTCSVHTLVWVAFRGPIEAGLEINHKDLNKWNPRLDNLELMTPQQNIQHAIASGIQYGRSGEGHSGAKLTWEKVQAIRQAYVPHKVSQAWLGQQFGVTRANVGRILRGQSWKT